jgi:hypothetical protein
MNFPIQFVTPNNHDMHMSWIINMGGTLGLIGLVSLVALAVFNKSFREHKAVKLALGALGAAGLLVAGAVAVFFAKIFSGYRRT